MLPSFFYGILYIPRNIFDYIGSLKVKKYIHSSKKIRTFKEDDFVRILDLQNSCFRKKDHHQIFNYSRLFRNIFYVFEENGKIIAYLGFYIHLKFENFKLVQKAVAFSGCVDEHQRGRGIYSTLYKECLTELKNNNVNVVYSCIRVNNAAALHVHEKLGFKIINSKSKMRGIEDFYQVKLKLDDWKI